jgi:uncharacterized protein CbrC (UPF0167 family)
MSDKPHFRFHPDAYEHQCFEESGEPCSACGRPCVWKYTICARCIADGSVAKAVPEGDYSLHDCSFDEEPSDASAAEVEQRTPGFSTYNPFVWPVRDGMPLAFLGFGEDDNLSRLPQVQAAIAALAKEMGGEVAPNYAMIFKTLHGDDYVATLDLD